MPAGIEQLRDIRGLDPISAWPPGPGWWLLAAAALLAILALALAWRWWRGLPRGSWRSDASHQLRLLRERMRWADARSVCGDLSELLRRIAMARYGRRSCAGLVGQDWLHWLEQHDPQGFGWSQQGRMLIEMPYAPPGQRVDTARVEPLVKAAEHWIQDDEPAGTGSGTPVQSRSLWRRWPRALVRRRPATPAREQARV